MPTGAEFLPLEVESIATPVALVLPEPVAALAVEPAVVSVVAAAPLEGPVADDETEDDEVDGLGHALVYTNWSGSPLQVVTELVSNVPLG